jgi:hypothetical protein
VLGRKEGAPVERFRAFALEDDGKTPVYIGTFEADNAKDAVREAVYEDPNAGHRLYEVHVLRNTSVFETSSRNERFVDSVKQLNTQQFFD